MGGLRIAVNAATGSRQRLVAAVERAAKIGDVPADGLKLAYIAATSKLRPQIVSYLQQNYAASGLNNRSGDMGRALANVTLYASETGFFIQMRDGLKYKSGAGDIYAAAGVFRYGGVRQPTVHAKGGAVRDLPTGRMRKRKYAAGAMGDKLKRTVKAVVLKTGKIQGLSTKQRDAFERAQEVTRKKIGKPIDLGRGITVLKPRPPFFELTGAQMEALSVAWAGNLRGELKKLGLPIK